MKRRTILQTIAAMSATASLPSFGQTKKIVFGYTAVTDFASVFVAAEEGYFTKRNLDVDLKFIPNGSTIPAAVQSDSLQIGGPTPSVFLQSVEGGLDHIVVAGGGVTSKASTNVALVGRAGSGVRSAQDCVGKKIGVPGLGGFLHMTFRAWLKLQGVDQKKVTFVEASLPQHNDLIRGGSLDAVVSVEPFVSRIVDSGAGYVTSYYATFLPDGNPTVIYVAKRIWVDKNQATAKAFRDAVQEAANFMQNLKNADKLRAHVGKYLKLPADALAKVRISQASPVVTEKQLGYWVDLMVDQGVLRSKPDVSGLLFKPTPGARDA